MSFPCEKCGTATTYRDASVLACAREGFVGWPTPGNARWLVCCIKCSDEFTYWIDTDRLREKPSVCAGDETVDGWIAHLEHKAWFVRPDFLSAVRRAFAQRDREIEEKEAVVAQVARTLWDAAGLPNQEPTQCKSCGVSIYFVPVFRPSQTKRQDLPRARWIWVPVDRNGTRHGCDPG